MRDGELIEVEGKAGIPIYTERILFEKENAPEDIISLRQAWLGE
ncbi:hypothetical protein [Muriicola soli]|nr:hypothetical protein [Muriicola soli]